MYNKDELIIDIYSSIVGPKSEEQLLRNLYPWVPKSDRRRLMAYRLLTALYQNFSQVLRANPPDSEHPLTEDGTASLIVNAFADATIGDKLIMQPANMTDDQGEEVKELRKQFEFIEAWRAKTLLDALLLSTETNCSMLGDGVIKLRWSNKKDRVCIQSLPPDSFFPEFDENDDYESCAIAWEEEDDKGKRVVYKEEYWIGDVKGTPKCLCTAGYYKKNNKPGFNDLELIFYKKNEEGSEVFELDLGIDFLPFVHIPNILVGGENFGESDLKPIAQLLDEQINAQTTLADNTEYLGGATMIVRGKKPASSDVDSPGPGAVFWTGDTQADAKMLETAAMSDAALKVLDKIEAKIFRNSSVTEVAVGMVSGSEIPSGVALQILQDPFVRRVVRKRLIRAEKYEKLLKFVTRFYRVFGEADQRFENEEFTIGFGKILPVDRKALLEELMLAVTTGLLTSETAIEQLRTITGWDIPQDEFERLERQAQNRGNFGI